MTTGKTIALIRQTFIGKVYSTLIHMDSYHDYRTMEGKTYINVCAGVNVCVCVCGPKIKLLNKDYSFYSVAKSCPALRDPMNCSTPVFSALHCLPECAQTYVHWIIDVIQPGHPLSLPSPLAPSLSQHSWHLEHTCHIFWGACSTRIIVRNVPNIKWLTYRLWLWVSFTASNRASGSTYLQTWEDFRERWVELKLAHFFGFLKYQDQPRPQVRLKISVASRAHPAYKAFMWAQI